MKSFRITVNGNTYDVDVEEVKHSGGPRMSAPAAAPSVSAPVPAAPAPTGGAGSTKVEAPMQGKIVAVKVSEGDRVDNGDVVAILEAMKMENEIVASESGTVASVNVAAGQSVDVGDLIITLD